MWKISRKYPSTTRKTIGFLKFLKHCFSSHGCGKRNSPMLIILQVDRLSFSHKGLENTSLSAVTVPQKCNLVEIVILVNQVLTMIIKTLVLGCLVIFFKTKALKLFHSRDYLKLYDAFTAKNSQRNFS